MKQLHMVYLAEYGMPAMPKVADGFTLRPYRHEDEKSYLALRVASGFTEWNSRALFEYMQRVLPDGCMVIADADNNIVAAATAQLYTQTLWPYNGVIGWVMSTPEVRGKGLGKAVVAAATRRLLTYGFKRAMLTTDDFRDAAVAVYLKLGWRPWMVDDDMPARWAAMYEKLGIAPVEPAPDMPPNGPLGY